MKPITALDQNFDQNQTTAATARRTLNRRGPAPLALEPRVMFDGATADAAVAAAKAAAAVPADIPAERSIEQTDTHVAAAVLPAAAERQEIVFIEDNVPDYQKLVAGVKAGVEVVVLDHTKDGLQQMIAALDGHAQVDAIHLVTHGANAQVDLGTSRLSIDTLDAHAGQLAALGAALSADGDILIYGCDVAGNDAGQRFVARMGDLTGADVAASTDVTGSKAFGGNWTLEAQAGTVETQALELDRAGWTGELETTVFDAEQRQLKFDGTTATPEKDGSTGTRAGDVMRFHNVIDFNGQWIDALVTTTALEGGAKLSTLDSLDNPSKDGGDFLQPNLTMTAEGSVVLTVQFVLSDKTTAVTLQNVVVNSYDIDSYGSTSDRQFQEFRGFSSYQLATNTEVASSVQSDGSVRFQYTPKGAAINNGTLTDNVYRVQVFYDSMSSFQIRTGAAKVGTGTFGSLAYFSLDFQLHEWDAPVVKSPAPALTYGTTTFTELEANDGSITAVTMITLSGQNAGGTQATFAGSDGQQLTDVSFKNLPEGLTAQVVRIDDTHAELRFTGSAAAHAQDDSVSNFGVTFGDKTFASGRADAVTGASRADLEIIFDDDDVAPVVDAGQRFEYAENRPADAVLGTVRASDDVAVNGFRFANGTGGGAVSADGYFRIGSDGRITLTGDGLAARAASNDYETGPNSFTHAVQARDAAGNWSQAVSVTLEVTDVDDIGPAFTSGASAAPLENQPVLYTAQATDLLDFTDKVVTYELKDIGDAGVLSIDRDSGVVQLKTGNLDFETKASYSFTVIARDETGNATEQAVKVSVVDIDEVPPTVTISAADESLKAGESTVLTFDFSEDVGDSFTASDVSLPSGKLEEFTKVSPTRYTALYTPAPDTDSTRVTISVDAGRFTDTSANDNQEQATLVLSVDTAVPAIGGPNGAPAGAASSAVSVPEGTTAVHTFDASEGVTWSLGGGEDADRFTITDDGALAFKAAPDFETPLDGPADGSNTYLVEVRATDKAGNSGTQLVKVTVTNVNEAPVAADTAIVTAEDTVKTGTLPVAADVDGDHVTYAKASDPAHGTVTIDDKGNYTYTPAADYNGKDSFTYTVSDGNGGANTYTVSVDVTPVNDAPTASDTSIETGEDKPHTGKLPQGRDVEGDAFTYARDSGPAHGTVTIEADGSYAYTPDADYNGKDSFTYTITDGKDSSTYTVDITVSADNDAPVAADDAIVTPEDTAATGKLPQASDVEGEAITYAKAGDPAHGTVTIDAAGNYTYTPNADYNGKDSFTYSVSDANGGSNTYTVDVTVTPVNDAPAASNASIETGEDMPHTGKLPQGRDVEGDAFTYAKDSGPSHGTVTIEADGSYAYTPDADYNGKDSFTYIITDGKDSSTYTVDITVTADNDAPTAGDDAITTPEDTAATGKLPAAIDIEGDHVTYAKASDPANGKVVIDAEGNYTYTPNANYNGKDSFTYTVSDGQDSNTYTVTVNVTPVNDAPTASNASIETGEDTPHTGKLPQGRDVEGDAFTYAKASDPSHGTVTVDADGSYTYTPDADYNGKDSFTYTITDGKDSSTYTVDITVTADNDAPVAADDAIVTPEDTVVSGKLPQANDVEGDAVTYAKASDPANGKVVIDAEGNYAYTPNADYNGKDSFTYTVSDGNGGSSTYTVDVTVTPVNDAPTASNTSIVASEDTPYTGKLPAGRDVEGDGFTYATDRDPSHGKLVVNPDGTYTYTPDADYNGKDSFTYTITDGKDSSTYTVDITVTATNDAPTAADAAIVTLEDTAYAGTLPAGTDVDGDAFTYAKAGDPAHGTVTIDAGGKYTYTPVLDYNGKDSFSYSVSDGKGGSNTYTVDVTVTPVNDAPVAHGGAGGSGTIGEALKPVTVPAFSDVDGPGITYTATLADGSPLPAWLNFDPDTRTFTGTPPGGSGGAWDVLVTGSDGTLGASVGITIDVRNPALPAQSLTIDAMTRDTGVSATDFITGDGAAGRTVSGSLGAPLGNNEVVQVSFDGGATWNTALTGTTVSGTTWSAVDNGAHTAGWTIQARVTNTAAGLSGKATSRDVVLDTAAPEAPTVNDVSTTSTTPVLTGTAQVGPGETLQVNVNGATYAVVPQGGAWTLDLATATPVAGTAAPLEVGRNYPVTATVTDVAGNSRSGANSGLVRVSPPPVVQDVPPAVIQPVVEAPVVAAPAPVAEPTPVAQMPDTRVTNDTAAPGSLASGDGLQYGYGQGIRATEQTPVLDLRGAALSDVYTRSEGFRTVVASAELPALVLFQGVPDQFAESGAHVSLTVPADAFAHTQPKAVVRLTATLQDGRPLPTWIQFNGQTGQFVGDVPKGLKGELKIKLTARDMGGREATALFRINVGQNASVQRDVQAPAGKPGLSAQLRATGRALPGRG